MHKLAKATRPVEKAPTQVIVELGKLLTQVERSITKMERMKTLAQAKREVKRYRQMFRELRKPDGTTLWDEVARAKTKDELIQKLKQLTLDVRRQISVNTVQKNIERWIRNFRHNLPVVWQSKSIVDLPPSKPTAVIVGNGQSLEKEKKWLKDFKGTIIVCDSTWHKVKDVCTPDYVVSADGGSHVPDFYVKAYEGVPNDTLKKTAGIFATVIDPRVAQNFRGEMYWFNAEIPNDIMPNASQFMQAVSGVPPVAFGGNIGSLGWLIARQTGAKYIALIGWDMCWDKKSSVHHAKKQYNESCFPVPHLKGRYTDMVFYQYAQAFLERLKQDYDAKLTNPEAPIPTTVLCTETSLLASADWLPKMRFKEFIEKYDKPLNAPQDKE